jgi:predicted small lipoprotein YifL
MRRFLLAAALLAATAACGQKGPLYFRDSPPQGYKPPKADPYKPVPYPKGSPGAQDAEGDAAGR